MPRAYEIVSDINHLTEEQIKEGLGHNSIKLYAYILHDKDESKNPHWHVEIYAPNNSTDVKTIARWFNVPEQQVEVKYAEKGNKFSKNGFINMCEYITHETKPEKHRYDDSEVKARFDWRKEVNLLQKERRRLKGNQEKEMSKDNLNDILQKIVNGEIKEYDLSDETKVSALCYIKHHEKIERALKLRSQRLQGERNRNMEVYYLYGDSETYKTTFAKETCKKNGWHYYISSSSNDPLEGYMGEEAIILDDLRPGDNKFSDLIKLLDNHTSTSFKSRYRNKTIECIAIFITTVIPIEDFYQNLFKDYDEPQKQLIRRCATNLLFKGNYIVMNIYDSAKGKYVTGNTYKNPYIDLYPKKEVTKDDFIQREAILGLTEVVSNNGFIPTEGSIPFDDEGGFLETPSGVQSSWLDYEEE